MSKKRFRSGILAEARLTQVCLNRKYLDQFEREPAYLEDVLVQEMAHVASSKRGWLVTSTGDFLMLSVVTLQEPSK